ncbi:hypothetical protein [Kordia sp.]|uniref:hypothetical protein n=1 Tax=Kordia sp. TaxID=1965332 RepID=UPI003D2DB3A6
MKAISISNIKTEKLTPLDFYNNVKYKMFGISESYSTLVPLYQELLREILGSKVDELFHDHILTNAEISSIKFIFEREFNKKLIKYKSSEKPAHKDIIWQNKTYSLDLRFTNPEHRLINDYFLIISICKECISENKPMYLSIE